MKKTTLIFTIAATIVWMAGLSVAKAEVSADLAFPSLVTPGDTFSFYIDGTNYSGTTGYILGTTESSVFGTTQTYAGAGYNGQNYTIMSSETVGASSTTDTFTVSTPTSFLTSTAINGTTINTIQFNLGASDGVSLVVPVTTFTATGNAIYNTSSTLALTPQTTFTTSGTSYSALEGITSGSATSAISAFTPHSFTYSITYSTVPEPSTWAMMGLGLVVGAVVVRRRRIA